MAFDTWGVDYGLLDGSGNLISQPYCYRDGRTAGTPEKIFAKITRQALYKTTGIQIMNINTLFSWLRKRTKALPSCCLYPILSPTCFAAR